MSVEADAEGSFCWEFWESGWCEEVVADRPVRPMFDRKRHDTTHLRKMRVQIEKKA